MPEEGCERGDTGDVGEMPPGGVVAEEEAMIEDDERRVESGRGLEEVEYLLKLCNEKGRVRVQRTFPTLYAAPPEEVSVSVGR